MASKPMDFGDYCYIEQHRFGAPNEHYLHKVIGRLESTAWVDVPVMWQMEEINHDTMESVLACICCGVNEREVRRYRESDCRPAFPIFDAVYEHTFGNDVNRATVDAAIDTCSTQLRELLSMHPVLKTKNPSE